MPMAIALPPPQDTRWSTRKRSGNSGQVYLACLHESVGITNRYDLAAFCERRGVSYNAIADNDGILYTVPRSDTAWHLRNGNGRADGLCLTTPTAGYTRAEWLGPQRNKVEIAAWWLESVTRDRGIDLARCNHQNIRDALGGNQAAGGVIGHVDYTYATGDGTHIDPRNFPFDVCIARAHEIRRGQIEEDDVAAKDVWDHFLIDRWSGNEMRAGQLLGWIGQHVVAARRDSAEVAQRTAGMQAAINSLADALANQQGVDAEEIKTAVRQAIEESVVEVDVTVADRTEGGAPLA